MDIDDAIKLKRKAIRILEEKEIPSHIEWLLNSYPWEFKLLKVDNPKGEKEGEKIDESVCFTYGTNSYELYCVGGDFLGQSVPALAYDEDGACYYGRFLFFLNKEIVLDAGYEKVFDLEDLNPFARSSTYRMRLSEYAVKSIKLSDWIEELPKIVSLESDERKKLDDIQKKENDLKEAREIKDKFDLGGYE